VILAVAQAAGQTGSWAALVAALPAALRQASPALWLAAVTAAWAGPAMLSPAAGKVIDSCGPRRAGCTAWLAASACAAGALAAGRLPAVLVPLGLMSACRGVAVAAGDTAPTWLPSRPDLTRAGSWLMLAAAVPVLAGPLGSASLLAWAGPRAAWAAAAGLLAAGGLASALVPAARPAAARETRRPTVGRPVLGILAVTAGIWVSYGALEILQPLYVRDGLHAGLVAYGWMMAAFALGSAAAALAAAAAPRLASARWAIPASALAVTAGERLFTGTASVSVALAGSAAWGASAAMLTLASRATITSAVAARAHGRALSLWRSVQSAADIAPAAVIGPLTVAAGLAATLTMACVLACAAALASLAAPAVWQSTGRHRRSRGAAPADGD
jgi:hypothetical protein